VCEVRSAVNIGVEPTFLDVYGVTKGASSSCSKAGSFFAEELGRFGNWNADGVWKMECGVCAVGEAISGLPEMGLPVGPSSSI
jgi:hypothetical protein